MKILIDGYNVMRSTAFADDYDLKALKNQRERFLTLLAEYAGSSKNIFTAVFDGTGSGELLENTEIYGAIEIRYSAGGETADTLIKTLVANSPNSKDIIVVTSDKEIAFYVKQCGARVVSAAEFYSKMKKKPETVENLYGGAYLEKYIKGYDEESERKSEKAKNKGKKRR
ncbi:MAG: NYN domain-containing protein [Candidatus Firestonebacteria bacterium]|nr:NYN domain-containing protein [Candidatus Firestonebacteria bacterium]